MSDSTKKQTFTIRFLLTGTTEMLHQVTVDNKAGFSLTEHAADFLAKGYEILESDFPQKPSPKNLKKKTYTVYLRERVTVVFPSQPKGEGEPVDGSEGLVWPAGLEDFDLTVTRSRVITYQYQDGRQAQPPVRELVDFERSAMVNHVTGEVTYLPWQAIGDAEFAQVDTPKLPGYTADILSVDAVEDLELETSSDVDIVVTYKVEPQYATVEVLDQASDKLLRSDELNGEINAVIDYPIAEVLDHYKARGYELVENPFETEQVFGKTAGERQVFRIVLKPQEILVHEGELPEVGQPVYPELKNSVLWPRGVRESKLRRRVTRTITRQHEDGRVIDTVEQVVEYRRPARINLLTQEVSYADWELLSEEAKFPAYVPEELTGYSPRPRKLPELTVVTPDSANLKEVVTYTRQIQRISLRFVDRSQQDLVLYQTQLVGKTGEAIRFNHHKKIQEFRNIGYDVIENDFPEQASFTADITKQEVYSIVLEPRTLVVSPSEPKAAGRFIDEVAQNGPKWPVGVDEQSLRHLVTRTIHYRYETGKKAQESHVDAILFEREAEINLVTGQVTYSPWVSQESAFPDHQVPSLDGYYANREVVAGLENIAVDSADYEVTVSYIKTSNQVSYTIQDVTADETLETKLVNGRSVQKLREEIDRKLQPYLAKGYKLENSQRLNLALKNSETTSLTIELSQEVLDVLPDQPQEANGFVTGYSQLNWPSGLEADQLNKTITRQVSLVYADGKPAAEPIVQSLNFTRSARVNLVTGQVTYGDWTSGDGRFEALSLPEIDGYTPNVISLPEEVVSAEEANSLVEVVYHAQPGQLAVVYLEEGSEKELHRDEFTAPVGEQLSYSVTERLPLLDLMAYDVVSTSCPDRLVFDTEATAYQVILRAKTVEVTADAPRQAQTTSWLDGYGLFNWPEGLDKASLVGDLRRVIRYKTDLGEVLDAQEVVQTARLTRSAQVNLATKEVSYQEWTSDVATFGAVENPEFDGLVPHLAEVPALDVATNHQHINHVIEEVVVYSRQPYHCQFKFVDSLHQEVLGEVALTVLDKKAIHESYQDLLSTYQQLGYVQTGNDTLNLKGWKLTDTKVFEVALKPQLMVVTIDHIDEAFASFDEDVASQLQTLEGLSRLDLSRQVNRTIKYLYTNGKPVSRAYQDSITFKRSARVNLVTGEIFYDDWTSYYPIFDEVLSPVVDDYRPSKEIVGPIEEVTADSLDIIETIIYTRKVQQVVVSVVDKATGNIIYAESITGTGGVADTGYEVSKFVKKGQDVVSDEGADTLEASSVVTAPEQEAKEPADQPQADEAVVAPVVETVAEEPVATPAQEPVEPVTDKPVTKKTVVIGFDDLELQKEHGLPLSDFVKTLNREIRFVDEQGKSLQEAVTQTLTFHRQATLSPKHKAVQFSPWVAVEEKAFAVLPSPSIEGYKTGQKRVASYTPKQHEMGTLVETIVYEPAQAFQVENISIVFAEEDTNEEILSFNFVGKTKADCEKKIKKGQAFLTYKGYEVVSSDYPDKGEVKDDTLHYRIIVRKKPESEQADLLQAPSKVAGQEPAEKTPIAQPEPTAKAEDKAASTEKPVAKSAPAAEQATQESKNKQKGFFDFFFKD